MTRQRTWTVRTADGGATGLEVANAALHADHDVVLAHALPERVQVQVVEEGTVVAEGDDLHDGATVPIALLRVDGERVARANIWPTNDHIGLPVILPGGEAGILRSWWNDDERSSWRWTVEFTNGPRFEDRGGPRRAEATDAHSDRSPMPSRGGNDT